MQPLHPELLQTESRARQVVQQYALHYVLSGQACRQLGLHPRLLGRITGNIWVNDSSGERVDVGLAVKNAKQGLCVPGEDLFMLKDMGSSSKLARLAASHTILHTPPTPSAPPLPPHPPGLMGRITGNIWVNDSSGERVDVGLAVKNAKQGLCVTGERVESGLGCRHQARHATIAW